MSKYLRPNIQLFAEPPAGDEPDSKPKDQAAESVSEELPKTQEELDALIANRLKREQKKWTKQQVTPAPATKPADLPAGKQATAPAQQTATTPADNTELLEAQRNLLQTRAELSAYKSGVKPEAVEDAVLLAIHSAEKSGEDVDEDSIADALKEVLKRHPEWKKEEDPRRTSNAGFRVGAGSKETPIAEDDQLSFAFGNFKK
ncbi:hypothetical protein [Clostridium merdae]|uniref:hypothetical protein n=1 Tax=Clostridium merdae TaxID=1958780 RepID=UPI000A26D3C6|nr:hypothetical protein [Clostridium merdae]